MLEGLEADRGADGRVREGQPAQVLDAIDPRSGVEIRPDEVATREERPQVGVVRLIALDVPGAELDDGIRRVKQLERVLDEGADDRLHQPLRYGVAPAGDDGRSG
jgi:hypothetical protein